MTYPADHPERFKRTKHVYYDKDGKPETCRWIIVDRHLIRAAEFHGRFAAECDGSGLGAWVKLREGDFKGLWFYPHGLELHRKDPPNAAVAPFPLKCCPLIGGDCYPIGSSLCASRFAEIWSGSDEMAFRRVRSWMQDFEPQQGEPDA